MMRTGTASDEIHWYINHLTARLVASSGIPNDRFHIGKIILQSLKDAPDFLLQIDGATGEEETCSSVLKRSVRMATCFRNMGLKCGHVISIMAPNHIDACVPFYAALYLGIIVSPIDRTWSVYELKDYFEIASPKLVFCQSERAPDVQMALNSVDTETLVVSFDKGDYLFNYQQFVNKYSDNLHDFKATNFNPEDTGAILLPTSGTTGTPKLALSTHKNIMMASHYLWSTYTKFPTPTKMVLIASPLQWLTAMVSFVMSPILRFTRLQTSEPVTRDHCYDLFDKYKPSWTILSPTFVTTLLKQPKDPGFLTSLEILYLGGSAVSPELVKEIKEVAPNTLVLNIFGMTELTGSGFHPVESENGKLRPATNYLYRLVNLDLGQDVVNANEPGELWIKGPGLFKEYYNNPKATDDSFAEDRWFKTGDLFYRDEHDFYYYVDRLKMMIKYKSYQISPVNLENLIRSHPGVLDVVVTSIPDPESGDLPVACVVRNNEHDVSAQDIKDLVQNTLSDANRLRGGVVFIESIPVTATSKVNRKKAKEMVLTLTRE